MKWSVREKPLLRVQELVPNNEIKWLTTTDDNPIEISNSRVGIELLVSTDEKVFKGKVLFLRQFHRLASRHIAHGLAQSFDRLHCRRGHATGGPKGDRIRNNLGPVGTFDVQCHFHT